jgi:hypothetical protein
MNGFDFLIKRKRVEFRPKFCDGLSLTPDAAGNRQPARANL